MLSRADFLKLMGATAAAGALAACSTGTKEEGSAAASSSSAVASADAGAFPVTIEHAFGSTTIEKQPTRVVGVGWMNGDISAALGVVPVAQATISWGGNAQGSTDWFDAQVKKLGASQPERFDETDGINATAIAAANPDLIINVMGTMSQEDYEKLSAIAPVVTFAKGGDNYRTSWDEATLIIGKALGKEQEAEDLVKQVRDEFSKVGDEHPEIVGATFIASYLGPGTETPISLYGAKDVRSVFFENLGMELAPAVAKADFGDSFYTVYSAERADELDSQFLYTWAMSADDREAIKADPLLSQIPAVAKDAFLADDNKEQALALGTTPLGMLWLLANTDFVAKVAEATKRGK